MAVVESVSAELPQGSAPVSLHSPSPIRHATTQLGGPAITITQEDLERSICRDSFYCFLKRFWSVVVPEDPVWNWHMEVLCDELQRLAERVFLGLPKEYDLVVNVPPGSTKSTICSIMYPAWVWTRMPTARLICGSYSYALALELSRRSRDVVQCERYQRLFGTDLGLREDQNTKGYFVNQQAGYRFSTSTGGSVTGFHGHFLVVDDPLNPEEAVSDLELKRANDWIGRTLSTRKVDKALTPTILIMQRLHENDPSALMMKEWAGVQMRHINLPAEIDATNQADVQPQGLRHLYTPDPDQAGSCLLDAVRMPRAVLQEFQTKLLDYGYAGQFLQRPVPLEGGMFKTERLAVDQPPSSWVQRVRFWDKAGTMGGGAYTVGLLMGEDREHRFWILDVIRVQLDSGEREKLIKLTAQMDGLDIVVGVEQEPGSGGKESAENTVRNLRGWVVEVAAPTGAKEVRAKPFSTQVNMGNVRLVGAPWNRAYVNELAMFPRSKFKDQVDASSGAFTVLTYPSGRAGVIK